MAAAVDHQSMLDGRAAASTQQQVGSILDWLGHFLADSGMADGKAPFLAASFSVEAWWI